MSHSPEQFDGPADLLKRYEEGLRHKISARLREGTKLKPRLDVEEVFSEVAKRVVQRWPQRSESPLPPREWLFRIGDDVIAERLRHELRDKRSPDHEQAWPDGSSQEIALGLIDSLTTPSQRLDHKEELEKLYLALQSLPERDRRVIHLREIEGLSFPEIGETLSITPDSARKRHTRALQRLTEAFESTDGPNQ
jgi:RNA polymerase sigma-70 factor (ECF subfamily)